VFDWFIPVGNYLDARAFMQKLKGEFVVSVKDWRKWQGLRDGIRPVKTENYEFADPGKLLVSVTESTFTRTVSASSPDVPLPQVHGLGEAMSWRRTANAVALLVGLKGR
jgi:hypothetical protein